ncbi:cyclin-T1-1-like [Oryza brachyantha]|uniref:cyclin-T1-1-like n=1 Tax=Oryza brachyantha TaxID=4533 RepID=UPI001ADA2311|nr:cyclin-T1-1-like [Oryza brachyantha]
MGKAGGGEGGAAGAWYVSREEVERGSPSRRDGVGAAKEAELRATYCSFIRDVGIRLQLPQVTIASAIMLCHRFYLRQSHAKNEWQTVATVCVFLASKIEDTPCSLQRVIIVAYETMYRKDCNAAHRIYQKEILEKQKELILVGETLLLSTIRFDFNIQHPYEPLKLALKKLGIFRMELKQVAVNLINDALRTTLVVQFKPHYIAAGSLYLAAKFNNVRLPSENGKDGKVWWHEFDVAPKQLEAVIQQMTELFIGRNPCSISPVIRAPPTPSLMERRQIIRRPPTPTLMQRQQQITSSLGAVMRHTHSSRGSLSSNFDIDASRCLPVDISANHKSAICSARNEGNQSLRVHMGHSNGSDARFKKQTPLGALRTDHVYHVFSEPKDLHVTGIRDFVRQKRPFHEVGEHPAPVDRSDRGAWIRKQHGRNVIVVDTKSSSWKRQKL